MKIVSVVGTRPNLIKIAAIIDEIRRFPEIGHILIHTGQHYDKNLSRIFFEDLGLPEPNYNLEIGSGSQTRQTAKVMLALEPLLYELQPDLVLVVGDVNSTLAASLVAVNLGFRLAHVEAGMRSFDRSMPEEINRIITDSISDYLFTTEASANENLTQEGIPKEKIFFVGNVMIDTLMRYKELALALDLPARYNLKSNGYGLLTLHRPSNVDVHEVLSGIVDAVIDVSESIPLFFPIHPRTRKKMQEFGLIKKIKLLSNIHIVEPLGYLEFLNMMAKARLVLTDSGGIQEETTILGVPCLTLRENTERPVTIIDGTNQLIGVNPEKIISAVQSVLNENCVKKERPALWDGQSAQRIVNVILNLIDSKIKV